jgi:hypothetical protein
MLFIRSKGLTAPCYTFSSCAIDAPITVTHMSNRAVTSSPHQTFEPLSQSPLEAKRRKIIRLAGIVE